MRISDWSSDVCSSDLKMSGNTVGPCNMFTGWGYITMRFDMSGCGESDGEFGRVIPLEQVEDTRAALSYLQTRQIGRASCRERVCQYVSISVVAASLKKKTTTKKHDQHTRDTT